MNSATTLRPGRRHPLALAVGVVVALALLAAPASAGPLDDLLGNGDDEGSGGGGGGGGGSTAEAPPPGEFDIEAEQLAGGTRRTSDKASGGAFLRTLGTSTPATLEPGTKQITVRAKAPARSRLVITLDGEVVAGYNLRSAWRELSTVVHVPSADVVIGVTHEVLPDIGTPREIDLDWMSVAPHAPVHTTVADRILAPDGTAIVPRGVTMPGYQAPGVVDGRLSLPPSFAAEQHVWGVTVVRIPLNQEHWLANCASTKDGEERWYRGAVAEEVDALTSRGIMVMLTLTRTERGLATRCAPAGQPVFKEMADRRSPRFWRTVANHFKADPLVGFDLFNEPHSITDDVWRNGGTITYTDDSGALTTTETYQAVGMQALINAVRGTGADNLLFVSGPRWAANPGAAIRQPIDGYGIVLASHTYCHGCPTPSLNPRLDEVTDEVGDRYPIVVSETGWIDSQSSAYSRQLVDWAASRGLGWTFYAWGHPDADYSLLDTWVHDPYAVGGALTMKPSPAGTPVWNELADVRVARGHDAHILPET